MSQNARTDSTTWSAENSPRTLGEALPIFLRHGSPRLLLACVALAAAARLAAGAWSLADLVPPVLILAYWPLQEWLIHVYVLHMKPFRLFGRVVDLPVPRSHRAHHRDPWNYRILFIPMHSFLYSIPVLILLCLGLSPTVPLGLTALFLFFALTLHYEWIHFLIHTRVAPRTRYYQRLWRNHRLHHFKNERYWMGVTRLEADGWLGTSPEPNAVPISPTARTLAG